MNTNITWIIVALIGLIYGIVARYLIPWLKNKMSGDQYEMLMSIASSVTYAVEQLLKTKIGTEKKKYAMTLAKSYLKRFGLVVDEELISAAIEAKVKEMKLEMQASEPITIEPVITSELVETGEANTDVETV